MMSASRRRVNRVNYSAAATESLDYEDPNLSNEQEYLDDETFHPTDDLGGSMTPARKRSRNSTPSSGNSRAQRSAKKNRPGEISSDLSPTLKKCKLMLQKLMKHRHAWPFNQPVDIVALGIPDYPSVIKYPMDFGTILRKLEAGEYYDSKELF